MFVDPFSSGSSGVSSYVALANELLTSLGFRCEIIKRLDGESIELFRRRLPKELDVFSGRVIVEAPETLAVTKYVPSCFDIHIRLHCSQNIGAAIQGIKYFEENVKEEQLEISRAKWVSSPSNISVSAARWMFSLPEKVFVYQNVMPVFCPKETRPIEKKVAFVGRWQNLKGIKFLKDLVRHLPDVEFILGVDRDPCIHERNVSWVLADSEVKKNEVFEAASLLVLPSLFETASMVGLEAISKGIPVVCWEHLGIAEYFDDESVCKVPMFDMVAMSAAVRSRINSVACDFSNVEVVNSSFVEVVNSSFLAGWNSIAFGKNHTSNLSDNLVDFPDVLERSLALCRVNGVERLKKKLKKFVSNPKRFFMDAAVGSAFLRRGQ